MKGKTIHYFSGGNTARGYFSLFDSNFGRLEKLFILKGGPGKGKSTLILNIAEAIIDKGIDAELIHCSLDPDSIDGVIFPELKAGIIDGTDPHIVEPKILDAAEEYVNLGDAWNSEQLSTKRDEIIQLMQKRKEAHKQAHQAYAEALSIHDEWEAIYIGNMDFGKLNAVTENLKTKFFKDFFLDKQSNVQHRFLGAATSKGAVDFVPNLTENIQKRYFLKGRPGSGKSTLLKKLAYAAESKGYDVEIYHCGFDPNSLDMLIFRELSIAIFDSTAPHEYFPTREDDEIVDLYKEAILPDTDKIFAEQINHIAARYRRKMNDGTASLAAAKTANDQLENIYYETVDFAKITEIQHEIENIILEIAKGMTQTEADND
ncbi:PRK06851 family protein [Solibacillus sp. FSL H8-0538]|uniref:PRK06851 family protein n=1 Tax=Solibacillus sp. FSL H8-0538 TaxID=2921400 RepID=UPI0030FB2490